MICYESILLKKCGVNLFTNYEQLETFFNDRKNLGIKPGLDRIDQLLVLMGHPEKKIKAIHVAGTNGKGSTISFLKNALIHNDYKVGTFISPSLNGLTGHIFCNDEEMSKVELLTHMNMIYPAIQQLDELDHHPTEFEIITVLAFMYFAHHVDIALIETGMGGREDTTNCFNPILSIITNISRDHTSFLGATVQEIAYHKAGIIKSNVPVVIGEVPSQAFKVLQKEALKKYAPMYHLDDYFTYTSVRQDGKSQSFNWTAKDKVAFKITLHMQGRHQVKNSSLAMMALMYLKKQGYAIDWEKVLLGIKQTMVPGRFEVIQTEPLIVLDGAHNLAGAKSFIETVNENYSGVEKELVFAAFSDKDLQGMLQQLIPHFTKVTLTSFDHPRAASAEKLFELIRSRDEQIYMNNDWKVIMHEMNEKSDQHQPYYFITGSLHFIALVREYFRLQH